MDAIEIYGEKLYVAEYRRNHGMTEEEYETWMEKSLGVISEVIGIPPEDLPRIFERFYRVDRARSREIEGTGLGLSIVKHLCEIQGGRVWVESQQGHGSRFHLALPAAKATDRAASMVSG